ncbi:MAG: LegC family aminotransferase [Alphaproteobacteria bacterium]|nr:LegC family aminotransferase [Alphaproteobacteria bacterium]
MPLCTPYIHGAEWDYVKDCLDSGWVSYVGSYVERFEKEFAAKIGMARAVATTSGTAALHLALLAAGVEPDDEVIVSALTFIAPVNAIRYVGAHPVLVDAEPQFWQMDVGLVESFLNGNCERRGTELFNKRSGRRVKAIVPVHILGHPVDMAPLLDLARLHGLAVIEDATESLGAAYRGRKIGSMGDLSCFSFNGNKLLTTGGGGMVVTSSQKKADWVRYLSTQAKDDPLEYVHENIGYNYRLTNVQAAIGCAQLEQCDAYVENKRQIATRYRHAFANRDGITAMPEAEWAESAFWLYTVLLDGDSRPVLRALERQNIQTRPLWQPIHLNTPYRGFEVLGGEVAEDLCRRCLSLPCSVNLTEAEQERVVSALLDAVS